MAQIIVRMKCITNLHVGNGDVNYNIIDNEVERDPITNYPTINASGVKGALREYFEANGSPQVASIFGADNKGNTTAGKLKILTADMLAVPMRASKGDSAYYLATTRTALERYQTIRKEFAGGDGTTTIDKDDGKVELEGFKPDGVVRFSFGTLYVLQDKVFKNIPLPGIARNHLINGISDTLWYEEIVPHESLFVFPVLANDADKALLDHFVEMVNGKVVQFGGNASIGYGLCKLEVEQ